MKSLELHRATHYDLSRVSAQCERTFSHNCIRHICDGSGLSICLHGNSAFSCSTASRCVGSRDERLTGYTKLFGSIIASSIWTEDDRTRIVWITMLAMTNRFGIVEASVPGLAKMAGVPVDAARVALEKFLAPDPDSRSKEFEGRRIEAVDGGWRLLNHAKYRQKMSQDDIRERKRIWDRENRGNRPNSAKRNQTPDSTPENPRSNPTHPTHTDPDPDPLPPVPPKGENGCDFDLLPAPAQETYERMKRALMEAFSRAPGDWDMADDACLSPVSRRPAALSEMAELLAYRESRGRFSAQDIKGLLNRWTEHLDKARSQKKFAKKGDDDARKRSNPRLEGVSRNNAVNDYAAAAKRKLEQQVAASQNGSPPKAEGTGA